MNKDPFISYDKNKEPDKYHKKYIWETAIGLQEVDGLKPSNYLIDLAVKNIEGELSIDDVKQLVNTYYETKDVRENEARMDEADKAASNISKILSEKAFSFTPNEYISIHKKIFDGIYKHAGKIRDYNITKPEWILDGDIVFYGTASNIKETLEYDFEQEKKFNYKDLTQNEVIEHLAHFTANLWQIHPFGEGNTRTTAVFLIKYLNSMGYDVSNDTFKNNAWYFRNALVRANYNNVKKEIYETYKYLELILRNLILNENNELHNRYLHISYNQNDSVNDSVKLSEKEKEILDLLKQNCNLTRKEILNEVSFSMPTIDRILKSLQQKDFIKRVGSDKTGYWVVLKK